MPLLWRAAADRVGLDSLANYASLRLVESAFCSTFAQQQPRWGGNNAVTLLLAHRLRLQAPMQRRLAALQRAAG